MGHTLTQWQAKTATYLRDAGETSSTAGQITAALRAAFMRYSVDRPARAVSEATGAGSSYFNLPANWAPTSTLVAIENPTGINPPSYLDDQAWQIERSPTDVTVTQILLLDRKPDASTKIRFYYTIPWPFPTNASPVVDLVDDLAHEAVAALTASLVITGLGLDAARRRADVAKDPSAKAGGIPDQSLLSTARAYEGLYFRYLGLDPDNPTSTVAPATGRWDVDPQYNSAFHGARR